MLSRIGEKLGAFSKIILTLWEVLVTWKQGIAWAVSKVLGWLHIFKWACCNHQSADSTSGWGVQWRLLLSHRLQMSIISLWGGRKRCDHYFPKDLIWYKGEISCRCQSSTAWYHVPKGQVAECSVAWAESRWVACSLCPAELCFPWGYSNRWATLISALIPSLTVMTTAS